MNRLALGATLSLCLGVLQATTLTQASLDDLIRKSTAIVRGKVVSTRSALRGSLVNTYVKVTVLERWKGPVEPSVEVVLPGGTVGGVNQDIAGVPDVDPGVEYVFFLWTGKSGAHHLLGLSQGVFDITLNGQGQRMVSRGRVDAVLIDAAGRVVRDEPVTLRLSEFSTRVRETLGGKR
ncbi:MAG: hypothetical protein ACRD96_15385 [Bryobacteraceae bacterium]